MARGNPHNYEAGFTIEDHRDELISRLAKALRRIAKLTEEAGESKEALRIACADAWPENPHWPELYIQRARNNMQVQRTER